MPKMNDRNIARVFPTKTKMCPKDDHAYFGFPPFETPQYDEVHISVTFTWDLRKVEQLQRQWSKYGQIKIGGPAYGNCNGDFVPGMYLKNGVTITSRNCPNNCSFCLVPDREGSIRELPVRSGNIIQDNNLLACSQDHIDRVFDMLRSQKGIVFAGGLETNRVTFEIAEKLGKLNIKEIWLSYDIPSIINKDILSKAIQMLYQQGFRRRQVRCYVLIGFEDDTLKEAESRLREVFHLGALPFAMRYRKPTLSWKDSFVYRERAWNELTALWTQPKRIFNLMRKEATNGKEEQNNRRD